jgi:hypothetical protein
MSQTKAQLVGGVGVSTVGDLSVYGGVNATGVITATSFSGDGSQLTGIDSTALKDSGGNVKVQANTSGIVVTGVTTITNGIGNVTIGIGTTALLVQGNARITGILTVGTGSITFDGVNNTINVGSGVTISASTGLTGSGANLTSLNASNLSSGTVPDARFPATLPSASGANLTSLNASNLGSGTVPDARFPATLPSASGANLTSLNASNISSGTLNNSRLPSNISVSGCVDSTSFKVSGTEIVNSGRCLTNIANATTSATANTYVLRGADGKICSDSVSLPVLMGGCLEGGFLIYKSGSGLYWIVSSYPAEVSRTWYCRNDANTVAQQVSGCTGWFVPTCTQLSNLGYTCRSFWDRYNATTYWSSTERNSAYAEQTYLQGGGGFAARKSFNLCVRSFRCVTY